jgi:hypothetical protein
MMPFEANNLLYTGIMQNYFEQDETLQGTSNLSLQLSFVGTIFNVFINLLGPLGQILLSLLQPRTVLFTSITICSIGLLLASFSKQVHWLYCFVKNLFLREKFVGLAIIFDTRSDIWYWILHHVLRKFYYLILKYTLLTLFSYRLLLQ